MDAKLLGNNKEFSDQILKAIKTLADPVKATLGPDGQPILIERTDKDGTKVIMTKDGVTVADSIFVEDPVQNAMIQAVKEAARKTNELAGDGTTSAIVLTEAIIKNAVQFIQADLITPQALSLKIKAVMPRIYEKLESMKKSISTEEEIKFVALISSNNDNEIAEKVTEAVMRSGNDGLIQLEDGDTTGIVVSKTEGYQIKKGWSVHQDYAPKMMTSTAKQEVVFSSNPNVLLYNGNFSDFTELAEIIKATNKIDPVMQTAEYKQLVIVAHEFSGQVRQMVADNMSMNGIPIMLVETEMMGTPQSRIFIQEDLATFSGGKVVQSGCLRNIIMRGIGPTMVTVAAGWLGTCGKIKQLKGTTTFYDGTGTKEAILKSVEVIKKQIEDCKAVWDKNLHKERLAKLVDGIVLVEVGGTTELEIKEKRDRVEDSLNATKAAIKLGVVPGGGVALLNCSKEMFDYTDFGEMVMKKALVAPIDQIIRNTGQIPDIHIHQILQSKSPVAGYDALNKKFVKDMIEEGIIDPYLVVKTALENAVSIGCELLRGGGYCVLKEHKKEIDMSEMMGGM